MPEPRTAVVLAVLAAVVLAGCTGADTSTPTTADGPGTATTTATTAATSSATTTTESTTTEPTTTEPTTETTTETNMGGLPPEVSAAGVERDALAAMRAVESYRLSSTVERTVTANGVTRTVTVESAGVLNRTARELRVNQTARGPTGSTSVAIYLVDRTIYQHSESYVRVYSSQWVSLDVSGNVTRRWNALDTMTRQRALLDNASVVDAGTATVDGTEAYVLAVAVNDSAYGDAVASRLDAAGVNVTGGSFTFYVARDSGRLLRSEGVVNSTVTLQGQRTEVSERLVLRFGEYGTPVDVTLPDGAETAVALGNRTTTGNSARAPPPVAPASATPATAPGHARPTAADG